MGICAGGVVIEGPEIEVNEDKLQEVIATEIAKIPQKVRENCESFPGEIATADPEEFEVPDTDIRLNKDTPEQDIAIAAIKSAFGAETKNAIIDAVWSHFEPQIDQQLDRQREVTLRQKQSAKRKFRTETIEDAVTAAMDEALKEMSS